MTCVMPLHRVEKGIWNHICVYLKESFIWRRSVLSYKTQRFNFLILKIQNTTPAVSNFITKTTWIKLIQ